MIGLPGAAGNAAVVAAGTGLGVAGMFWDGRRHHPFACEGGHAAFAPAGDEERRRLASLGYLVSGETPKAVPDGAPRAADMTALFGDLDAGSLAFVDERYALAAKAFEGILARDPGNLMTVVRLVTDSRWFSTNWRNARP